MSELTKMFVNKNHKIMIEISVNGNADLDKVVKELYTAHKQNKEIMAGVTISQIYFKEINIDQIVRDKAKELVYQVEDGVRNFIRNMNKY